MPSHAFKPTPLTEVERRRLYKLSEELGEAQQAIGKILLHGYEAIGRDGVFYNNRRDLENELGDIAAATQNLASSSDIKRANIDVRCHEKYPIIVAVTSTLE